MLTCCNSTCAVKKAQLCGRGKEEKMGTWRVGKWDAEVEVFKKIGRFVKKYYYDKHNIIYEDFNTSKANSR